MANSKDKDFRVLTVTEALLMLKDLHERRYESDSLMRKYEELNSSIMCAKRFRQMVYGDGYVILP